MPPSDPQRKWVGDHLGVASGGGTMGLIGRQAAKMPSPPRIPSPADAARRREAGKETQADDPGSVPPTQFGPNQSPVQNDDSRLSPDVEYEKLPKELKEKLNQQFWGGLGKQQRWTLTETFSRMKGYGLWKQVKSVVGEKDGPEPHVAFGGFEFQVAGNSGGIQYEAVSGSGLVSKLKGTGNFGEDGSVIGALHKGQRSMREWSSSTMSLHISVGPGNLFDAHIDKISPTSKPDGGKTRIDPVKGKEHHTKEVWPEKIRKKTGVPGVIVEGSVEENKEGSHGAQVKVGVKVELRGPVKKDKPKLDRSKPRPNPPADEIVKKIVQRAEHTKNYFPVPIGAIPDEVPLPKDVASELAAKMLEAGRKGDTRVIIDLNYYLDAKDDQPKALEMMREIGQIVRSELGAQAESVNALLVTFGTHKQGGTVSVAD